MPATGSAKPGTYGVTMDAPWTALWPGLSYWQDYRTLFSFLFFKGSGEGSCAAAEWDKFCLWQDFWGAIVTAGFAVLAACITILITWWLTTTQIEATATASNEQVEALNRQLKFQERERQDLLAEKEKVARRPRRLLAEAFRDCLMGLVGVVDERIKFIKSVQRSGAPLATFTDFREVWTAWRDVDDVVFDPRGFALCREIENYLEAASHTKFGDFDYEGWIRFYELQRPAVVEYAFEMHEHGKKFGGVSRHHDDFFKRERSVP